MKVNLGKPGLEDFKASDGWLDKWKLTQCIRENQISGESMDVCETTVESGGKVQKPIVIRKSKNPRCFLRANVTKKILQVYKYFLNRKSWIQVEITKDILVKLNQKIIHKKRSVILFTDDAIVHPISLKEKYSNIKIVFLLQNTTSYLQPLNAGIIQSCKVKYRKKLMRFVLAQIAENRSESKM